MFVGLHKINEKRKEEIAINFTNLYVKNIGNMTVDVLRELFTVSLFFCFIYHKFFILYFIQYFSFLVRHLQV